MHLCGRFGGLQADEGSPPQAPQASLGIKNQGVNPRGGGTESPLQIRWRQSSLSPEQSEKAKARYKRWAIANREKLNAYVRKYRAKRYREEGRWADCGPKAKAMIVWMSELKSKPCADCHGMFEICSMDFDHRDGTVKKYNIGSMFAHHYSRELIEKELEKCDLVCCNCHRVRTRNRRTGSGKSHLKIY